MALSTVEDVNVYMADKSYVKGYSFSSADVELFSKLSLPDKSVNPHAYRWYVHIAALTGVKCLALVSAAAGAAATPTPVKPTPKAAPAPAPAPAPKVAPTPTSKAVPAPAPKKEPTPSPAPAPTEKSKEAEEEDDDVDDWFAEDDDAEDDKAKPVNEALEKAKAAAMEKLAKKEAKQRSLWSTEQDLMALFNKVKEKVVKDGLVWSQNCELKPVAFGLRKIALTAVINQTISMDEIIEEITEDIFPDEHMTKPQAKDPDCVRDPECTCI